MSHFLAVLVCLLMLAGCGAPQRNTPVPPEPASTPSTEQERTETPLPVYEALEGGSYWQPSGGTQAFRLAVHTLLREKRRLRYHIVQNQAQSGAFLSVAIDNTFLVKDKAIGKVQPTAPLLISDELDISSVLRAPGHYELTFTLKVIDTPEKGWLLRKIELIGVDGTLQPHF